MFYITDNHSDRFTVSELHVCPLLIAVSAIDHRELVRILGPRDIRLESRGRSGDCVEPGKSREQSRGRSGVAWYRLLYAAC